MNVSNKNIKRLSRETPCDSSDKFKRIARGFTRSEKQKVKTNRKGIRSICLISLNESQGDSLDRKAQTKKRIVRGYARFV